MRHNDIDIYYIYMLSVYHIQITSYLHASAFLNTPLPQVSRCRFGPSQLSWLIKYKCRWLSLDTSPKTIVAGFHGKSIQRRNQESWVPLYTCMILIYCWSFLYPKNQHVVFSLFRTGIPRNKNPGDSRPSSWLMVVSSAPMASLA